MIIGLLLITRNKNLAYLFARDAQGSQWHFTSSVARQNFAIIGAVCFVGGLVFFFLL